MLKFKTNKFILKLFLVTAIFNRFSATASMIRGGSYQDTSSLSTIPVRFMLKNDGFVTLVIEDLKGVRVRNLISETWLKAGENTIYWDGLDDLGRDADAANHGVYSVPGRFISPGMYHVRGIVHNAIVPEYEFSVYSPGNPPWNTNDHKGGWLANHTPPQAALFVPADQSPSGQPLVYLGCYVTEGLDGLAWVDLSGNKLGGKTWVGGNWTAAPFLARDAGNKAITGTNCYVASAWETGRNSGINELRISAIKGNKDYQVFNYTLDTANITIEKGDELRGFAIYNNIAVISLYKRNLLLFIDILQHRVIKQFTLDAPSGLFFDSKGRLLTLTGNRMIRFDLIPPLTNNLDAKPLIVSGLESPFGVTLDNEGNIYVSDRGISNQVKVFSADGKLIHAIGNAGPPKPGPYNPMHINNPAGITIDSKQHLWVTEQDYLPKRVSVWTLDGKLINAFYGPGKYGGGGSLDGYDNTHFYYAEPGEGAMDFKIDWTKGTSNLDRVYYRPGSSDMALAFRASPPETALYRDKQRYFTNCYNTNPSFGHTTAFLFIDKYGIAKPVAAAGSANAWELLKQPSFSYRWPNGLNPAGNGPQDEAFFIWSDINGDGNAQPNEVTIKKGFASGITLMPDLSFCVADLNNQAVRFIPVNYTEYGTPVYDIKKGQILVSGVMPPASDGGNQVLTGPDQSTVITLGIKPFNKFSISGSKNGVPLWSYPNLWPGLHASHQSPIRGQSGEIIGATRLLGGLFDIKGAEGGPFWAINGNQGNIYLFTSDGLFVSTIFADARQGRQWRMPVAERKMDLSGLTLNEENFWPTIAKSADGSVYMVDGDHSAIVSFDGLSSIRKIPAINLFVSKNDIESCRKRFIQTEAIRQKADGLKVLKVAIRPLPLTVDGNLDDWAGAVWADIDKSGVKAYFNSFSKPYNVTGALAVDGDKLYAAYKTDIVKLQNSGEMPTSPFITGEALDLMIGTDPTANPDRQNPVEGDIRLIFTMVNDKPYALLYKAVIKNFNSKDRIYFSSPSRTVSFDMVKDITSQVQFATLNGNYEISIPLSILNLQVKDGMAVKGDMGVLHGGLGYTTARTYWANKSSGSTADVPSEAELIPKLWGTFKFQSN